MFLKHSSLLYGNPTTVLRQTQQKRHVINVSPATDHFCVHNRYHLHVYSVVAPWIVTSLNLRNISYSSLIHDNSNLAMEKGSHRQWL
jgi:hypothetical protein